VYRRRLIVVNARAADVFNEIPEWSFDRTTIVITIIIIIVAAAAAANRTTIIA